MWVDLLSSASCELPCPSHRHGGLLPATHPTSRPDGDWHPPKNAQCFWVWLPPPRAGAGRQWMRIPTPRRDGRREVSRHIPFLFGHTPRTQGNLWSDVLFIEVEEEIFAPRSSACHRCLLLIFTNSDLCLTAAHTRVSYLSLTLLSPWSHYFCVVFLFLSSFFFFLWH